MRDWDATDYLPADATYLNTYDASKPTALEVIDPGCTYCRQLFRNIKESGFSDEYNLSYIAYPIQSGDGYKFQNSLLVAQYLEAARLNPVAGAEIPADWNILINIYTGENASGTPYQSVINGHDADEVTGLLQGWLADAGMTPEQVAHVAEVAASDQVATIIKDNRAVVEDDIHTVKIPTIIYDGRRHDGLVSVDKLG
jgi:hypothetical protein